MSGRKNAILPFQLFTDEAIDDFSDLKSVPINIQFMDNVGFQVEWTGDPVGVISVQFSLNYVPGQPHQNKPANAGTWYDLTFDPALAQPAGAAGGYGINCNQVPYPWLRLSYVGSGGSGVFNAWTTAKMI
jgi:hypothetical protein